MKLNKQKLFFIGFWLGVLCGTFLLFGYALAQPDLGLNQVGETIGLPQTDIRVIIANIIRVALGLLGIVALVLVLYGGFVWMTAGGNADKVAQAKKILVNAVIGLVIILSAYAIVSFVMNQLIGATSDYPSHCFNGVQDEGEEGIDCGGGCTVCGGGVIPGADNIFYVQQKPSGDVCVRNFYAIVVFNKAVNLSSVSGNLVVRKVSDQSVADGSWQFLSDSTQNSLKFVPNGDCGDGISDCLDPSTDYELVFVSGSTIQSQDGLSLNCGVGVGCNSTQFTTGEGIDREPPTIIIEYPNDGERLQKGMDVATDIVFTDDNGVQNISLYADGGFITSQSIGGCVQTGRVQLNWPTVSASLGNHTLRAVGWDYSSAEDDDQVTVNLEPTHCFNGIMDEDETGIDCGGECGVCGGESCVSDEQCASGYCEILPGETEGICVDKMQITNVSPLSGAFDTYVTISGRYFGSLKGKVFMTAEGGGWIEAPIVSCGVDFNNWTDAQIVVSVPRGAADGPLRVDTETIVGRDGLERQFTDTTNDDWGPNFVFDVNDIVRPGLCLVDPSSGPPYSTTVQVLGQNFGASENNPSADNVKFGELKALINNWSDGLIRAKVPGLGTGFVGVSVENEGVKGNSLRFYVSDDTNVDSPVIYSVTPAHGARGEYVTVTGENFGTNLGKIILKQRNVSGISTEGNFDFPPECEGSVWTDKQIIFKIPDAVVLNQEYSVQVQTANDPPKLSPIGGYFLTESGQPSPGLCKIDPISGPVPFAEGKSMSFFGEYFTDNNVSAPYFWSLSGDPNTLSGRVQTIEFLSWWDRELVVRPPVGAVSGPVVVNRSTDGKFSNPLSFSVFDCVKNNNNCTVDGYKCCTLGADAGVCRPEGELCEGETRSTGYMWRFSTRDFPLVPRVLESCDNNTDLGVNLPSPSPSTMWNAGNNDHTSVCRNALVTVGFTAPVAQSTVNSATVHVYKCSNDASGEGGVSGNTCRVGETPVALASNSYTLRNFSDGVNNYFYLSMLPNSRVWDDSSWYQVVLDNRIESVITAEEGSYNLKEDKPCGTGTAYCFVFRTDSSDCKMKRVVVTPFSYWTSILEEPVKYRVLRNNANDPGTDLYYTANGLSSQHCIWMDTSGYNWTWSSDNPTYAPIYSVSATEPNQAQVSAIANTVGVGLPGDSVGIRATASRAGLSFSTTSPLTIDLSSPEVVDYWPSCLEACPNAQVGVRFNLAMSNLNLSRGVKLFRCNDENCYSKTAIRVSAVVNPADRREIIFTPVGGSLGSLVPGTLYQAVISSSSTPSSQLWTIGSAFDSSVLGKAYTKEFTWRFRAKKEACSLDRVVVTPDIYYAPFITARTVFSASAYSSPDQCRPMGQRLDEWNMQWNWTSTDSQVANVVTFNTKGKSNFCTSDCLLNGSDIPYGGEFNEPLCGNGVLEAGEDCDNPNKNSGCSLNCLLLNKTNTGSLPQTEATDVNDSICGNGLIGEGEDCDLGIAPDKNTTNSSLNCSEICLHTGSELSASWCLANKSSFGGFDYAEYAEACSKSISKCGDGLVAPNEDADCETGIFDPNICTENCLLINECNPYDTSNQAAGRLEGCSLDGKFMGSSLLYSTPSVCGDGVTGFGEHPACEGTITTVHTLTDPWALVVGKGLGTLSGDPPSQRTKINTEGTQQTTSAKKSDNGDFVIQCGYTSDYECNQNLAYCGPAGCGVGDDTCCYPRPEVLGTYPASTTPSTQNICPNTYIEVVFDKKLDPLSLDGNIYLARGSSDACLDGEENINHLVALENLDPNVPWYKKIWHKAVAIVSNIKNKILETVFAQAESKKISSWCSGSELSAAELVYEPLPPGTGEEINTVSRVFVRLKKPLAYSTKYAVVLRPGIRDIRGVSIGSNVKWRFVTDDSICLLDSLTVIPDEYLFDKMDEMVNIQAVPKTFDDRIIQPVPGYNWSYLWGPENNDYVFLNTTTRDVVAATTRNRNGEVDMLANVKFIENIFSDKNPELSATSKLTTFICENPWPGLPGQVSFVDYAYDFSTYYCMDSGTFGTGDDLPNLKYTVKNASASSGLEAGVLRKYLFSSIDVPDAIGVSLIANPNKESVYNLLSLSGFDNYQKLKVKGYDAITDGYNIYIDAMARSSSGVAYSNVYLFSLNQNSGPEMKNIFDQMIDNLEFNLFADNVEYCGVRSTGNTLPNFERPCKTDLDCAMYSDTKVCLNIKDKVARNYSRFKDLRTIKQLIEDYKVETGNTTYPTMAENTYLSGQAASIWPNAWNELSSSVGILPVDPINKLRRSGTCYLDTSKSCVSDDNCSVVPASELLKGLWLADGTTKNNQGNGDGVIVGTVNYTPGKGSGQAFEFLGEDGSYVDIPHNDNLSPVNSFSISLWFKPTKQSPSVLIKKGGLGLDNEGLGGFELSYSGQSFAGGSTKFNNGTLRFAVYDKSNPANYYVVDTPSPLELNKWHHIAVVFNSGSMSIVVDGGTAFSQKYDKNGTAVGNVSNLMIPNTDDIRIGQSLNGSIDNIYFYNEYALPASFVTTLYNHLCIFHDENTGWSTEDFRFSFACNTDSLVYRYVYDNSNHDYTLRAKMENDGFLLNNPFLNGYDKIVYDGTGACLNTDEISSPSSLICGDGIVGAGESCDPPGTVFYDASACPSSYARKSYCTDQCTWITKPITQGSSAIASCREAVGGTCGDGEIQTLAGEKCDDGELNGQIWRCKSDCSGIENTKCGNGVLDTNAGELCDPTVGKAGKAGWCIGGPYTFDPENVAATFVPCNNDSECTTNQCYITNVKYGKVRDASCNWDCKTRGPYCGDSATQEDWGEDCDGDIPCVLPDGRDGQFNCLDTCRKDNTSGGQGDMLALWEFDSIGPNGEVYDTIGNYNGSCKSGECPAIVEGKHPGNPAFDFMGQTRLVTINDKNDKTMSTPPFSWEMWFNPVVNSAPNPRLLEKGGRDSGFGTTGATGRIGGPQILVYPSMSAAYFYTRYFTDNRDTGSTYISTDITLDTWHHLIAAFEPTSGYVPTGLPADHACWNGTMYLYLDGDLQSSKTTGKICNTDYPLCFGVKCDINGNVAYDGANKAYSFKGAIEDIAFYDKVIDRETIGDHANGTGWYCTAFPDDYYNDDPESADYVAYCGNNIVDEDEVCDLGSANGVPCTPATGSRCSYCAYGCDRVLTMERY